MKKIFILFLFTSKLFAQNITSNLVICMPMDNGLAQDISGNGNNGVTTSVVAAPDRFGNPNSALQFFGSPSQIVVPPSASINNIETLQELTITAWCKISSFAPYNCFPVANKYKVSDDWGWDYTIQPPATWNGQILIMDFNAMGANYGICVGNEGVTTNQWDFYAITFNKAASTFKVYKNTTLLNTVNTGTYGLEATANGSLYIGASPANANDYANGFMDDFKMYSRALTQAEIMMIYNNGSCICSVPANPASIIGNTMVCTGSSNMFGVAAVPGATSYSWTLSGGWTGFSSTNTINITAGISTGTISVVATNSCGSSSSVSMAINVATVPSNPSSIIGNTTVCSGSSNIYGIGAVAGATSYSWTLSGGWSGVSATTTISAVAGAANGILSVVAINSCGSSSTSTMEVIVSDCGGTGITQNGFENLNAFVSIYPNPNNGSFFIGYKHNSLNLTASIVNVLGQELYNSAIKPNSENEVNLGSRKGLFFLRFYNNQKNLISQKKLIIE